MQASVASAPQFRAMVVRHASAATIEPKRGIEGPTPAKLNNWRVVVGEVVLVVMFWADTVPDSIEKRTTLEEECMFVVISLAARKYKEVKIDSQFTVSLGSGGVIWSMNSVADDEEMKKGQYLLVRVECARCIKIGVQCCGLSLR